MTEADAPDDERQDPLLGELFHAGFVVADIDEAITQWRPLGVTDWNVTEELEYRGLYHARQESWSLKMAFAYPPAYPIVMELAQPIEGIWTASEVLRERGEGLYHLGYWSDNPCKTAQRFRERGGSVDAIEVEDQEARFAFLDTRNVLGVYAEVVKRGIPWGRDL